MGITNPEGTLTVKGGFIETDKIDNSWRGLCTITVAMFISAHLVGGQSGASSPITRVYNPYPPGILPSDLRSESARVQREVDLIEERALARWHTLKRADSDRSAADNSEYGDGSNGSARRTYAFRQEYFAGQKPACASCHMPYAGFSGPIPSVNLTMVAFPGTVHFRAGKRTPQRHPYSPFFPVLQYNPEQGLFFGGNFWDSRATGYNCRYPTLSRPRVPPSILRKWVSPILPASRFGFLSAVYRPLFEEVWGELVRYQVSHAISSISAPPREAPCSDGNTTPVPLSAGDRTRANIVYDHWAQSIDSFEQSVKSALSRLNSTRSWQASTR